jgi:hypothetical protein
MRRLICHEIAGADVDSALAEFNEKHAVYGLHNEADLVSIDVRDYTENLSILTGPNAKSAKVVVSFIYWG